MMFHASMVLFLCVRRRKDPLICSAFFTIYIIVSMADMTTIIVVSVLLNFRLLLPKGLDQHPHCPDERRHSYGRIPRLRTVPETPGGSAQLLPNGAGDRAHRDRAESIQVRSFTVDSARPGTHQDLRVQTSSVPGYVGWGCKQTTACYGCRESSKNPSAWTKGTFRRRRRRIHLPAAGFFLPGCQAKMPVFSRNRGKFWALLTKILKIL